MERPNFSESAHADKKKRTKIAPVWTRNRNMLKLLALLLTSLLVAIDTLWLEFGSENSMDSGLSSVNLQATCINSSVPCLIVRSCLNSQRAKISSFQLTNTAPGIITPAKQQTRVDLCHTPRGLHISSLAFARHIFSPYHHCNDPVFVRSETLEVFIAPVRNPWDNPIWYWELDAAPTGAMWAGLSRNPRGNASNCPRCPPPGTLNCSGLHGFDPFPIKLSTFTQLDRRGWGDHLLIPFSLFASAGFGPAWPAYRANFYRYGYPDGPDGAYELSGWSPTFDPSFHVPPRFGVLILA